MPPSYTAIYSFGDSLSDAGNAYLLTSSTAASLIGQSPEPVSPPYAQETYGGLSADVFSNGPVWVQDLAVTLGLTGAAPSGVGATASNLLSILTPTLGQVAANAAIGALETAYGSYGPNNYIPFVAGATGGTDFAIGGAVTGVTAENTGAQVQLTDLQAQLATFNYTVPTPSPGALYTVWMGSNDLLNLLEDPNYATLPVAQDVAASVVNEVGFIGQLISAGAKNLLVVGVPDLSKAPEITQLHPGQIANAASISAEYNTFLQADIAAFESLNPTVHFTYEDTFGLIDTAVANPGTFGLTDATDPVWSGSFTSASSGTLVSTSLATQDTYLFFDHLHPTAAVHAALGNLAASDLGVATLACFARGTRIATPDGPVAVEDLRVGDRALAPDGTASPIVWIGTRTVACAAHAKPASVMPVRIRAHAFGPARPERDLVLSPDHAVFADGALIPVKHLVDGDAIATLRTDSVNYFHVELPRHGLVLAENLPCESFLDTGQRTYPDRTAPGFAIRTREAASYTDLVVTGPRVAGVRASIAAHAYAG